MKRSIDIRALRETIIIMTIVILVNRPWASGFLNVWLFSALTLATAVFLYWRIISFRASRDKQRADEGNGNDSRR